MTPVDNTLGISSWEFEWLNDGKPIREIRLEPIGNAGETIDWRL